MAIWRLDNLAATARVDVIVIDDIVDLISWPLVGYLMLMITLSNDDPMIETGASSTTLKVM